MRVSIFILLFGISAFAAQLPEHQKSLAQAEKNYLISLNHANDGVVLSTIKNIILLKLLYPKKNYSSIIKKLDDLSINSNSPLIRLKAFFASNYLKRPKYVHLINHPEYKKIIRFFNSLEYSSNAANAYKQALAPRAR